MGQWLFFECALPLSPVAAFYLLVLLLKAKMERKWAPIRDGQACFYCTTTSIIAIRDLASHSTQDYWWLAGPITSVLLSLVVYCAAIFTTLKPEKTAEKAEEIDNRISWASILCVLGTIVIVGSLRSSYGLFDVK
jgi:hypothetical protein